MTQKKVSLLEFDQNPNIGLYMFANDKFAIIGPQVTKEKQQQIEKVLQVPIYKASANSTELIGIFVAGNNDYLIIPDLPEYEQKTFKKICEKHQTKLIIHDYKMNTFGNNLCFADNKILINHNYPTKFKQELSQETGYQILDLKTPELENAGAIAIFKNGKYFLNQQITEENVKPIVNQVAGIGTINAGSTFVSSGIIANSNGILIGSHSTTIEIQNIVEGLDYL